MVGDTLVSPTVTLKLSAVESLELVDQEPDVRGARITAIVCGALLGILIYRFLFVTVNLIAPVMMLVALWFLLRARRKIAATPPTYAVVVRTSRTAYEIFSSANQNEAITVANSLIDKGVGGVVS